MVGGLEGLGLSIPGRAKASSLLSGSLDIYSLGYDRILNTRTLGIAELLTTLLPLFLPQLRQAGTSKKALGSSRFGWALGSPLNPKP